ncbi:DUF2284 domain-containing protein [Geosporobacter ferrireducens]|uniref:Metal-binding protein n=1 Tax=Geosporobacter ferrireducens TaxID=1424294 RepID=A0A1D8GHE2_9FIRM|nr:DUF2284 domain-containing protein [Geosporobacter ferrireducens]AOT70333.1 metal-binding protein [Geosporobacter ferrireducens]MTI54302.1 DUF2284 domain-containing protein [Geosporobacter ferrireducens]
MTDRIEAIIQDVLALNAAHAAVVGIEQVKFSDELRKLCEQNKCGMYGSNWMCPPGVGTVEDLKARAMQYGQGLLFQTIHPLKSSFDMKGMMEGKAVHTGVFKAIRHLLAAKYQMKEILPLNVGPCGHCEKCAYKEGKECYFPEEAVASVEAYGIDVMGLTRSCGIPYNNGKNTVSYISLILYNNHSVNFEEDAI